MDKFKIGSYIADKRKKAGMTQAELADRIHVTDKAVSRWETGKGLPDMQMWEPLAHALSVSVEELVNAKSIEPGKQMDTITFHKRVLDHLLSHRKRYGILTLVCAVLIVLTGYSYAVFETPNFITPMHALLQVQFSQQDAIEIRSYPKMIVAKSDADGQLLRAYMKKKQFDLESQSGNYLVFVNHDEEEVISVSNNGFYTLWKWYE